MFRALLHRHHGCYVGFLALTASAAALSTDMYLPALPTIARQWGIGDHLAGLSLVLWFVSFSSFLLVMGPLSDKYGRRPVLLLGLGLFVAATFLCAAAMNITQLIVCRMLQGIGASAPASMCMAICRDRFEGERRKQVLAYIGMIVPLIPLVAPMLGSVFLELGSWRWIFVAQGLLAAATLLVATGYMETAGVRTTGNALAMAGRYQVLLRNRRYLLAVSTMGLLAGPFFGFLAFSPTVYMKLYGLPPRVFSLLFGLNAGMGIAGAFVCTRLTRHVRDTRLLTVCLAGSVAAGAGILMLGGMSALGFAVPMAAFTLFFGMSRPLASHLILEQVSADIGSASSFLVFYQFLVGAGCMALATAAWERPIMAFGIVAALFPAVVLLLWPLLLKQLETGQRPAAGPAEAEVETEEKV